MLLIGRATKNLFQPIRSTTQNLVVTRQQNGISALVLQMSFLGETSGSVVNVGCLIEKLTNSCQGRICEIHSPEVSPVQCFTSVYSSVRSS